MSKLHSSTDNYSLRLIGDDIDPAVVDAVVLALEYSFEQLKLTPHLFVTIVPAHIIEADGGSGVALYLSGVQAVVVAGVKPEMIDNEDFIVEVKVSVLHECVHYSQDLNGTIDADSTQSNEDEADQITERLGVGLIGVID